MAYVEAHGTGTKAGDPEELNAITSVFCKDRAPEMGPLLIGSVKSNMGHPEPASGLCGVTKVLLAMQHRVIPPNLHFNTPNPDIPSLIDGRLKVRSYFLDLIKTRHFTSQMGRSPALISGFPLHEVTPQEYIYLFIYLFTEFVKKCR